MALLQAKRMKRDQTLRSPRSIYDITDYIIKIIGNNFRNFQNFRLVVYDIPYISKVVIHMTIPFVAVF